MKYLVELLITQTNKEKETILASVESKKTEKNEVTAHIVITKEGRNIYEEHVSSTNQESIELIVVDRLRSLVSSYNPDVTSTKVIKDDRKIFTKLSYACCNCNKKFFDSWGKASGVVVKCIRCQRVGYPVERT